MPLTISNANASATLALVDEIEVLLAAAGSAEAVDRARALYRTVLHAADILGQSDAPQTILRRVCDELARSGLFVSSRIGALEDSGKYATLTLRVAGGAPARTRKLRALIDREVPHGGFEPITPLAWRTETTQLTDDYDHDERLTPWRDLARRAGWRSMAAVPIFRNGQRWAVLTVDAGVPGMFNAAFVTLLERLAGMVGRALDEIDLRRSLRAQSLALTRRAMKDPLTLLPNRLCLLEHLRARMMAPQRGAKVLGIALIDIDEFGHINRNHGHGAGDTVLRIVGKRLALSLRDLDFVARLDGDEFALVLEDWNQTNADGFCRRLATEIGAPIRLENIGVTITISIGFTLFPQDDEPPEMLLRHAGLALQTAKASRRDGATIWCLYQPETAAQNRRIAHRHLLLQGAVVHYQPIVDVRTGEIAGTEALARLEDGKTLLLPGAFLKDFTVEDRYTLFRQVLKTGLRQLGLWDAEGYCLTVSVNVDAQILLRDDILTFLDEALASASVAPERLVLEILETHEFFDLTRAKDRLAAVRERGVRIALDDLGAGYSSIMKLRDLPIDVIKLDRAFTSGLHQRPDDLAFIAAFQLLARTLGMMLVVEGVETAPILDAVRIMRACQVQGFGIARPMAGWALSAWLRSYRPEPPSGKPTSLLGAYAAHLNWLRGFQFDRTRGPLLTYLRKHNPFDFEDVLADHGLLETEVGRAYRDFQTVLRRESVERVIVAASAEQFRKLLVKAVAALA